MATTATAAVTAFEVVGGGEDDAAEFILVEVFRVSGCGNFSLHQRENLCWIIRITRVPQYLRRHVSLPAPTRAHVEAAFRDAAMIRVAAQRTASVR
jgi:hypothetical protein